MIDSGLKLHVLWTAHHHREYNSTKLPLTILMLHRPITGQVKAFHHLVINQVIVGSAEH